MDINESLADYFCPEIRFIYRTILKQPTITVPDRLSRNLACFGFASDQFLRPAARGHGWTTAGVAGPIRNLHVCLVSRFVFYTALKKQILYHTCSTKKAFIFRGNDDKF